MAKLKDTVGAKGFLTDGDWILSENMDKGGSVGVIQLKHIGVGEFLDKDFSFISEETFNKLKCTEVQQNDVLISRMAEPIARACVVPKLPFKTVTAVDVSILRVDEDVADRQFIKFLCNSDLVKAQAAGVGRGTTRQRITRKELEVIEIPLPKPDEQKRIAAILDKADRLRRQRRFAQTLSNSFLQSVFIKMFGDEHKVKLMRIEEVLAESPKNGLYLPGEKYGYGTPIIRINNFYSGTLAEPITFKRVQASHNEIEEFNVINGDVLINRVNSLEYLGKCAFVKGIKEKTVYESNMIRLRLRKDLLSAIYLVTYLSSKKANLQIQRSAKKAVNQASINQTDVESFIIPVPPLPLQEKFAAIVRKFERVRRQQREATRQAEHLFQTLLHRAFRGEL